MESMGERLKRLRVEHDMTQEDVGKVLGIQKAAINKYEKGNVENIKRSSVLKLAKLYNVKPSYLLCLDDNEDSDEKIKKAEIEYSRDEQQLIKDYRSLSTQGKEYIRQQMFMALNIYEEADNLPELEDQIKGA